MRRMIRNRRGEAPARWALAALLALAGFGLSGVEPAEATETILQSQFPYWQVGDRDPALSKLCALGQFNETDVGRYNAQFKGTKGPDTLGIAKGTGFNLRDPGHHAVTKEDYFFLGDGTSNCSVFVGGRHPPPPGPGGKPGVIPTVLVRSHYPYWQVGVEDPALSQLCSAGQFNQITPDRYTAQFQGSVGAGTLGIAKGDGLNLKDPQHRAVNTEDYFFHGDGTKNCAVFVGGRQHGIVENKAYQAALGNGAPSTLPLTKP